jgi:hypothetical protein
MSADLRGYWKKVASLINCHGIGFTLWWCPLAAIRLNRLLWFASYRERHFDTRHGVNTAGNVEVAELGVQSRDLEQSIHYEPSTPEIIFRAISDLVVDCRGYVFIDLGSGKGLALLVASLFPFKRIIGVEWSQWLTGVARENVRKFRNRRQKCRRIEVVNANVASYRLPDEPLVIYLFNPFKDRLVRRVLENLRDSLKQSPRPIVLIYYNPVWKDIAAEADFLRLVDTRDDGFGVTIYESSAPAPEQRAPTRLTPSQRRESANVGSSR